MIRSRLALSVAVALLMVACSSDADPTGPDVTNVPSGCTEVPIATSPEKFTLFTGLAETFNAQGEEFDGECVAITVYRVSSGAAARMLVRRAGPTDGSAGTGPGALVPGRQQLGRDRQRTSRRPGEAPIANDFERVMITPLVLGMPRPMAEALGWPEAEIGWSDILDSRLRSRRMGSVRPSRMGRLSPRQDQPQLLDLGALGHCRHLLRRHRQDLGSDRRRPDRSRSARVRPRRRSRHRPLRRHHPDLPRQHVPRRPGGSRASPMPRRSRSKRSRSSPTTGATRPTPAPPARPPGAAGGGLSHRGNALLRQPGLHPRRSLGHRCRSPGRNRLPRLRHRRPREPAAGPRVRLPTRQPGGAGRRPDQLRERAQPRTSPTSNWRSPTRRS